MILCNNTLEDIIEAENVQAVEKFYSKKNEVYKVTCFDKEVQQQKHVVVKKYLQSKEKMKGEIDLLLLLKQEGLAVPEIYQQGNDYIVMEYIEGKTLLETIEERESVNTLKQGASYQSNHKLIESLIEWMGKFYNINKSMNKRSIALGDVNLRNFIVGKDEKIYGIDFEDCGEGEIQKDGAKLCAYTLTYTPAFTPWKIRFIEEVVDLFAKKFAIDKEEFIEEVEKEINHIKIKRGNL